MVSASQSRVWRDKSTVSRAQTVFCTAKKQTQAAGTPVSAPIGREIWDGPALTSAQRLEWLRWHGSSLRCHCYGIVDVTAVKPNGWTRSPISVASDARNQPRIGSAKTIVRDFVIFHFFLTKDLMYLPRLLSCIQAELAVRSWIREERKRKWLIGH